MRDMEHRIAYINGFVREAYDEIRVIVPKGSKERIKARAKAEGKTMSGYIVSCLPQELIGRWRSE